jgi:hypothetical protein
MPGILAFDAARVVGYAATQPGSVEPKLGAFVLRVGNVGEDLGALYAAMRRLALDLVAVHQPDAIWFEQPMLMGMRSAHTAQMLMGLGAIIECVAAETGIQCFQGHVNTVRRYVIGRRLRSDPRSAKQIVLDYCHLRGWHPPDDNAADAAVLWVYAYACARAREGS